MNKKDPKSKKLEEVEKITPEETREANPPKHHYGDPEHDDRVHANTKPKGRTYNDRWHYPGG